MSRKFLIFTLLFAFTLPATADLTIEYADGSGERVSAMYIKGDDMRMDTFGRDQSSMLFNANRKELTIVEQRRRRYTVIDQSTIVQMREAMEQAMQMIEQMGMSRDQLAGMMPGLPEKFEIAHRRTGQTRQVDGRRCEVVETLINGEIESITCVVPPDAMGVGSRELATLKALSDMLTQMAADVIPGDMLSIDFDGMDGLPLEAYDENGRVIERLANVSDASLDASMFAVPRGFRRQSLEMGR